MCSISSDGDSHASSGDRSVESGESLPLFFENIMLSCCQSYQLCTQYRRHSENIARDATEDYIECFQNQEDLITPNCSPKIAIVDNLDEIKPLLQNFPMTKPVAVGISQNQQQQALEEGAIAVCLEGSTNEQIDLAIRAALQDFLLVSPTREIIVLPFVHRQAKIPKIIASLGAKLINDWRHHDSVQATEIELVEQLSLFDAVFESNLILELEKHLDNFRLRFVIEKLTSINFIHSVETWLYAWMHGAKELNQNGQLSVRERLIARTTSRRQILFDSLVSKIPWQEKGSLALYRWLKLIFTTLKSTTRRFEQEKLEALKVEAQALRSLETLYNKLQLEPTSLSLLEGALNALQVQFTARIHVEFCGVASQLVSELIAELQGYLNLLAKTDSFLHKTQKSFELKGSKRFFENNLDSLKLRQKWQSDYHQSIHNLEIMELTNQDFQEQITRLLYPTAFSIYFNKCLSWGNYEQNLSALRS